MTKKTVSGLTAEHIRHATPTQIGKLIDKNPNTVSRWNRRGFKTTDVDMVYPCVDRETLITGLIGRREKFKEIQQLQKEFDEILDASEKVEPISA